MSAVRIRPWWIANWGGYGAAAVLGIADGQSGVMVAFEPPDLRFIPLAEAITRFRTVPPDSVFVRIARSLGTHWALTHVRSIR